MDTFQDPRLDALHAQLLRGMRTYMADEDVDYAEGDIALCGAILDTCRRTVADVSDEAAALEAVRTAVLALNVLNEKCGLALIETDQREDICAFVLRCLEIRGFNEAGEDPTFEWREW